MPSDYIRSVSYTKLLAYQQPRAEQSIRKYVLIANMLRATESQQALHPQDEPMHDRQHARDDSMAYEDDDDDILEQEWLDTCLDALDQEDDDDSSWHAGVPSLESNVHHTSSTRLGLLCQDTATDKRDSNPSLSNEFQHDSCALVGGQEICAVIGSLHPSSPQIASPVSNTRSTTILILKRDFRNPYRNLYCRTWSLL